MKPFTGIVIATFFINLVIVSLHLGNAYVFKKLIDSILHNQAVVWRILALFLIIVMTGALQIGYGRLIFHLSAGYTQKLKNTMFQVISTSKLKDIYRHGEGELISRFNVEVSGVFVLSAFFFDRLCVFAHLLVAYIPPVFCVFALFSPGDQFFE